MSNGAQARDTLGVIEAGRLSASNLEHPDLQPLLHEGDGNRREGGQHRL